MSLSDFWGVTCSTYICLNIINESCSYEFSYVWQCELYTCWPVDLTLMLKGVAGD